MANILKIQAKKETRETKTKEMDKKIGSQIPKIQRARKEVAIVFFKCRWKGIEKANEYWI